MACNFLRKATDNVERQIERQPLWKVYQFVTNGDYAAAQHARFEFKLHSRPPQLYPRVDADSKTVELFCRFSNFLFVVCSMSGSSSHGSSC